MTATNRNPRRTRLEVMREPLDEPMSKPDLDLYRTYLADMAPEGTKEALHYVRTFRAARAAAEERAATREADEGTS